MNRRELLKFSLFSPLLGLFKKKEKVSAQDRLYKNMIETGWGDPDYKASIGSTTDTSSEGPFLIEEGYWNGVRWICHNPPPDIKWFSLSRGNGKE